MFTLPVFNLALLGAVPSRGTTGTQLQFPCRKSSPAFTAAVGIMQRHKQRQLTSVRGYHVTSSVEFPDDVLEIQDVVAISLVSSAVVVAVATFPRAVPHPAFRTFA